MKKILIIFLAFITLNSYGSDNILSEEDIKALDDFVSTNLSEEEIAKRTVEEERRTKKIKVMFEENSFVGKNIEDIKQILGPDWEKCSDDIACIYTDFASGYSLSFLKLYTDENGKIIDVKIIQD